MFEKKLEILQEIFGDYKQQGEEFLFFCPNCEFHKKKLSFNISKNCFKCWYCDFKAVSIYWAISKYGSHRQKSTWRELSGIIDLSEEENLNFLEDIPKEESVPISLPKEFKTLATKKDNPLAIPARKYLASRNISQFDIAWWKIGHCTYGQYKERIIIPSFDLQGNVNYFIARNYKNDFIPYKNPPAPHNFIFNELYLDWDKDVVLCEGVFDAIVAGNAIPLLGSTLREDSYALKQMVFNQAKIFLALDPDAESKENKIKKMLLQYGLRIFKIKIYPYKDIGSMSKEEFKNRKGQATEITNESEFESMIINV